MKKAYIYILLTALMFSTIEVSGKIIGNSLDPMQVTFLRFFIGSLMLFPLAIRDIKKNKISLKLDDILFFVVLGSLCIPLSMVLLQLSVTYTKASTAAVVFCTNPVFTMPLAFLILKEKIDKGTVLSMILSFVGIIFIFNPIQNDFIKNRKDIIGMLISLAAAIIFALYAVLSKKRVSKYGGNILNTFTFIFGDIVLFIILLLLNKPVLSGITSKNVLVILYMGIIVTGAGYIVYFKAMENASALKVSSIFFIKPALAPLLSFLILGEIIKLNVIMGIILILFGSYINFKAKSKREVLKYS